MKTANADISIKVSEVRTRQATLSNFDTTIKLNNGNLNINPLSLNVGKGKVSGNVNINASQNLASVNVNLNGKSVELGQLEQLKETLTGGSTNITLKLSGKGNTSQAIAGNANGKLLVQVGAAEMKRDDEKSGFLASIGKLLNPFSAKDNAMLECAVLNFNLKDGLATANKGIGIETQQITVSGGGDINLKNEKLSLGFEPNAKGAVAGAITNLTSGMMAGGTLANPKIKINPAGVAMGALKSVAGVAGGAGSLIGGLFGKDDGADAADSSPCQTALTGKSTPAKTKKATAPSKTESVKKDALKSSKKLLKGLFD